MKRAKAILLCAFCVCTLSACGEVVKQIEKNDNSEVVDSYKPLEENNIEMIEEKELVEADSFAKGQVEVNAEQEIENDISSKESEDTKEEISLRHYDSIDLDLLKLENKEENMVYSPLSIKYALGMLREGASDEMKAKIDTIIGENFEPIANNNSENYSLANGLFIRNSVGNEVKAEFINNAHSKYGADVVLDNFSGAETINGWIKDKTFGILDQVMTDIEISELDVALINTIAIDMNWLIAFCEEGDVDQRTFYKTDNTEKKVLGLSSYSCIDKVKFPEGFKGDEYMPYPDIDMTDEYYKETGDTFSFTDGWGDGVYQDSEINVISKYLEEYDGRQLEFVAIMPKNKTLKEYIADFSGKELNTILSNLTVDNTKDGYETYIYTMFPKFQFEYDCQLKENLTKLGLQDIFSSENNNFQKIMDDFYISDAKQKTQIDVNEQGIKAASTTMLGGLGGGGVRVPIISVDIFINRPFLFFIIDKDTKDIVFTGTVYDPTDYETASQSIE